MKASLLEVIATQEILPLLPLMLRLQHRKTQEAKNILLFLICLQMKPLAPIAKVSEGVERVASDTEGVEC